MTKGQKNKVYYIKMKPFVSQRALSQNTKATPQEKICTKHVSDKGLISRRYFKISTTQQQQIQLKNGQSTLLCTLGPFKFQMLEP